MESFWLAPRVITRNKFSAAKNKTPNKKNSLLPSNPQSPLPETKLPSSHYVCCCRSSECQLPDRPQGLWHIVEVAKKKQAEETHTRPKSLSTQKSDMSLFESWLCDSTCDDSSAHPWLTVTLTSQTGWDIGCLNLQGGIMSPVTGVFLSLPGKIWCRDNSVAKKNESNLSIIV